jgi:hypothetical protein
MTPMAAASNAGIRNLGSREALAADLMEVAQRLGP